MKLRIMLPTILAVALFWTIPGSMETHAMSLGAAGLSIGEPVKTDDSLVVLAATVRNPPRHLVELCHHIKNRHNRVQCYHSHGWYGNPY
jgi:hypothetical protein